MENPIGERPEFFWFDVGLGGGMHAETAASAFDGGDWLTAEVLYPDWTASYGGSDEWKSIVLL